MRQTDFNLNLKADDISENGEFSGYVATFGNVDQGGDVIAPGAFAKSLSKAKRDGRLIPMLWQHDRTQPIGKWNVIEEDKNGLRVEGKLHVEFDDLAKRAYGHLKNGSVGGFSIGYNLVPEGYSIHPDNDTFGEGPTVWLLTEIDLREASIVTMPMNLEARVVSIKNEIMGGYVPTEREFESLLREACGFSKRKACAIASAAKTVLDRGEPANQDSDNIVELFAKVAQSLRQ